MEVTAPLMDDGAIGPASERSCVNAPKNPEETLPISAEGYEHLCRELDTLRKEARRELGERMREARRDGDLADNPALRDLLEDQAQLERWITLREAQLAAAEIVAPARDGLVGIGSVVRVRDEEGATFEFELVGPLESDVGNGCVSVSAPVGKALEGQRAGGHVEVTTPRGLVTLQIESVRPQRGEPRRRPENRRAVA
jgi:transcription elongation factor GreA